MREFGVISLFKRLLISSYVSQVFLHTLKALMKSFFLELLFSSIVIVIVVFIVVVLMMIQLEKQVSK